MCQKKSAMTLNYHKDDPFVLRQSLKLLVDELIRKHPNANELLLNSNVALADIVFQTFDTKLAQLYFNFLRSVNARQRKRDDSMLGNIKTRDMVF